MAVRLSDTLLRSSVWQLIAAFFVASCVATKLPQAPAKITPVALRDISLAHCPIDRDLRNENMEEIPDEVMLRPIHNNFEEKFSCSST
jgi:hypothetical protein